MRYLLSLLVFSLSFLATGQNVLTTFSKVVFQEDFKSSSISFPQKYNASELFIVENEVYRMKRIIPTDFSVTYPKPDLELSAHSFTAEIELIKSKSKDNAGGIVIHGQSTYNGAIILEINNKKKFRVRKLYNEQEKWLTGAEKDGWLKSKALNKKGINKLEVRTQNGYYDIYFNNQYVYTVFDLQYSDGKSGLYINGGSEMLVYNVETKTQGSKLISDPSNANNNKDSNNTDASFQDVILIFKTKIDQQQAEITKLQRELDRCKSTLNYDTALVSRSTQLQTENKRLTQLLDSTSKALVKAEKRLVYLESFKEDIEQGSNGDLVINLTTILATIKKENKSLSAENETLKKENDKIKDDNTILLREIDRLRKLVELQNPGE